jgi:hypothetical protein
MSQITHPTIVTTRQAANDQIALLRADASSALLRMTTLKSEPRAANQRDRRRASSPEADG